MHKYFEIDFQESSAKKAATIKKNKAFTDVIGDPDLKVGKNLLSFRGSWHARELIWTQWLKYILSKCRPWRNRAVQQRLLFVIRRFAGI